MNKLSTCCIIFLNLVLLQIITGQSCDPSMLIQRELEAAETDVNISSELQKHQVFINPDCPQNGMLVLHLVGTFDNPANTTYFPSLAANNGFRVINLKYKNGVPALTSCENSRDEDCYFKFRQEIIFGIEESPRVTVDTTNSVINRLEKLLYYLEDSFPSENWAEFLTITQEIDWSNIVISGHSQGAGHAAFIAKKFDVERVLMFAGPNDYSSFFSSPAKWTSSASVTPVSNYYAFGNLFDQVSSYANQFEIWEDLGMSVIDSTNVDSAECNYSQSKMLYTRSRFSIEHNNMIIDEYTPIVSGSPFFNPVWEYMLGICELTSDHQVEMETRAQIELYPNPTAAMVIIESQERMRSIEVYDGNGRLILHKVVESNSCELDLELSKGLLMLKIEFFGAEVPVFKTLLVK